MDDAMIEPALMAGVRLELMHDCFKRH
jgi:hypothetical protein